MTFFLHEMMFDVQIWNDALSISDPYDLSVISEDKLNLPAVLKPACFAWIIPCRGALMKNYQKRVWIHVIGSLVIC